MDFSILKNRAVMDLKVVIDSAPPQIFPLSSAHNINPGGTCLTGQGGCHICSAPY